MIINYPIIMIIYLPVLLLLLLILLKDKYQPEQEVFKLHKWSLLFAVIMIGIFSSFTIIQSLWYWIPILRNYEYNSFHWNVFSFIGSFFVILLVFIFLHFINKASIIEIFGIKASYFQFIFKLCGVMLIINILSISFLDSNLLLRLRESQINMIKSMDYKSFILFFAVTGILMPVAEESVFRGLLYAPIFRKVGRHMGIILSSLIWAYMHFEPTLISVGLFLKGVVLGWLYDRSGSLLHPVIFHIFTNSWIIVYYIK